MKILVWVARNVPKLTLAGVTAAPWLMWLDLNVMALRFVFLRGNWPMCPTALPCQPLAWCDDNATHTLSNDPVFRSLDPSTWQLIMVLCSLPAWCVVWFTVRKNVSVRTQILFFLILIAGWMCLIFDPTHAVDWYLD